MGTWEDSGHSAGTGLGSLLMDGQGRKRVRGPRSQGPGCAGRVTLPHALAPPAALQLLPQRWDPSLKTNPPRQPWSPTRSPSGPYCVWSLASQASRILWTRQHCWNSWQTGGTGQGQQGCTLPSTQPWAEWAQQAAGAHVSPKFTAAAKQHSPACGPRATPR